jgi:hypothetical protein
MPWCKRSVNPSIEARNCYVKLPEGIISVFPLGKLIPQRRRMDPAGLEPASAAWTERCVSITPRAHSWSVGATFLACFVRSIINPIFLRTPKD